MPTPTRILVRISGGLSDLLFAASLARLLKAEGRADWVTYLVNYQLAQPLLSGETAIDEIVTDLTQSPHRFDDVITLPPVDYQDHPLRQLQQAAGIQTPDLTLRLTWPVEPYPPAPAGVMRVGIVQQWPGPSGANRDVETLRDLLNETDRFTTERFEARLLGLPAHFPAAKNDHPGGWWFLHHTLTLLVSCDVVVGGDTFLLRLAGALGVPTICDTAELATRLGPGGSVHAHENWLELFTPAAHSPFGEHVNLTPFLVDDFLLFAELEDLLREKYPKSVSENPGVTDSV